jgi:hypothetical protein
MIEREISDREDNRHRDRLPKRFEIKTILDG